MLRRTSPGDPATMSWLLAGYPGLAQRKQVADGPRPALVAPCNRRSASTAKQRAEIERRDMLLRRP